MYFGTAFLVSAAFAYAGGSAYNARNWYNFNYPPPQFNPPELRSDFDFRIRLRPFVPVPSAVQFQMGLPQLQLQPPPTPPRPRPGNISSCRKRCNTIGHNTKFPCQCNVLCLQFEDCCPDYERRCLSCTGKCFSSFDKNLYCQCNQQCEEFKNCCEDFEDQCAYGNGNGNGNSQGGVTDPELAELTEQLLTLENNVATQVTANLQGETNSGGPDNAPVPLLKVNPEVYNSLTMPLLVALHDNYVPAVGTPENVTPQEQVEENDFLDAILSSSVMKRTEEFLVSKGLVSAGSFRDKFAEIWFGLYSRSGNVLGSSGFEHSFLGELKNGVSGFHNWAFFAREEASSRINYKGYISTLSLGSKGSIIIHSFDWLSNKKPISSMFIGTSPEFELALYTVCWYARPNAKCPIKLNGQPLQIQTYDITYNEKKFVASAYPAIA